MKTVYFVVPGDINTRTGGYRYDKAIVQALQELDWRVNLISLPGHFPFPDQSDRQGVQKALEAIPDKAIVVIDGLAYSVVPDQLEAHQHRLHLVALIHHPLALETGLDANESSALEALEIRALQFAEQVITTSPSTAQSLQHYAVDAGRIAVVCPGTDPAPVASGGAMPGLSLLCVATVTPRKGHKILINALKMLEQFDWHLNCAGSTDRDRETVTALQDQCRSTGLASRIRFLGELDDHELAACYQQADLFVLASFHEGYGMVFDEAIARGLPIVATAGGAIADTVPHDAGLLCPPGDSHALATTLRRVLQDDELLCKLRQGALIARESQRSWTVAAREFDNALKMISNNRHG